MIISPGLDWRLLVYILRREHLLKKIQGGLAYLREHTVFKYLCILMSKFLLSTFYVLGAMQNPLHVLLAIILLDTLLDRCYY